jgi:hypothetical protein
MYLSSGNYRSVFLKLSAVADHFIGTPEPPQPKVHASNSRNIIPVVKVTITTFFIYTNLFYKIIKGRMLWKEQIRLLYIKGQPTKAVVV